MFQALFRPSPDMYGELGRLQGYLDSVLRPMERSSIRAPSGAHFPILNIGATADAIEIMALAPGIDPAALQLTVDRGLLIIAGERANPLPPPGQGSNVYAQERFAGAFRRVVSLPDDADPGKIDASYRDGILRVTVARRESARPRRIDVN
jgi:HSP20 family protein